MKSFVTAKSAQQPIVTNWHTKKKEHYAQACNLTSTQTGETRPELVLNFVCVRSAKVILPQTPCELSWIPYCCTFHQSCEVLINILQRQGLLASASRYMFLGTVWKVISSQSNEYWQSGRVEGVLAIGLLFHAAGSLLSDCSQRQSVEGKTTVKNAILGKVVVLL